MDNMAAQVNRQAAMIEIVPRGERPARALNATSAATTAAKASPKSVSELASILDAFDWV
jgi:hypothetical protein